MLTPESFIESLAKTGVTITELRPSQGFIKVTKRFTPGSGEGYTNAESECSILYSIPKGEPGSVWGTDGGSIGGMVGMRNGQMVLNRSGCSKRFLAKVEKLLKKAT
jgi:hypothetical protein